METMKDPSPAPEASTTVSDEGGHFAAWPLQATAHRSAADEGGASHVSSYTACLTAEQGDISTCLPAQLDAEANAGSLLSGQFDSGIQMDADAYRPAVSEGDDALITRTNKHEEVTRLIADICKLEPGDAVEVAARLRAEPFEDARIQQALDDLLTLVSASASCPGAGRPSHPPQPQ